ncbi:aminoglycoside phosphotransferase family protein [Streptomyces scopuliridis]|uniref:Aminoglycoside phosphotransferase family protein n=1 Tax=Streptomyces scopuliridis TaxID=452529 RepID=A0ACD4ZS61_9ACTN|nr:aminoglycoside phosphotransferase family protein [Streptomyces scopuliridis]WSC01126.1 aminoglycoside phosphotransferase family protein [Streptomyces scopuliridis]WSC05263.1 aminoglycoside phosphotransferase family protein [Streptomyces scopuliridis]
MTTSVVRALGRVARDTAHPAVRAADPAGCRACGESTVLADRPDGTVVRHGEVVAKAHADGTDPAGHRVRLAVAAHPLLAGVLLPPLPAAAEEVRGRPVTAWPYGTPVDPNDPDAAPWEQAGTLLARLHALPLAALSEAVAVERAVAGPGPRLPDMRGPAKAARAVARMRAAGPHPAAVPVERAWQRLPAWARGEARAPGPYALCHGDLHLGQLVRHPAPDGPWLLIDIDDLGLGDPAWDLGRPAAWYAAGLLPPETWLRFLGAYRSAHGPAVPAAPDADPWPRLDVPARALTVQTAALALAKSTAEGRNPDDVELLMIDACARIADLATEFTPGASS